MQVSNPNNVKIYNLSAGKSLPEWLSDRKKRALQKNDVDIRRRVQLMQDFDMPTVSNCISMSANQQYIFVTGVYKPRVRCYDVAHMSMKFERCMDAEVLKFILLAEDYTKIVFLQTDRYVEFHNQNGRYYRTRIPMYGRDFAFHEASAELYFEVVDTSIRSIRLVLGRIAGTDNIVEVLQDSIALLHHQRECELYCCQINPHHNLFASGTSMGQVVCFDPRTRNRVGLLDCTPHAIADNTDVHSMPSITSLKFRDHLHMAVGTATGQVLLYDLRSDRPYLVKDHNFGLPIKDIEFHQRSNLVLSCDSRILKLWEADTGKAFTSVEPTDTKLNDLCVVPETGMLFLANEAPKVLTYYIPALGPAPKWCAFLDSITEELEENVQNVYDDYKFVTRSELESLGLGHLIGTEFIRAYMHGFFLDIRLYHKAKSITEPFAYEEYRQKRIREKIEAKVASRVKTKALPKVNRQLAAQLLEEENDNQKKKKKSMTDLLHDDRFSRLFTDTEYQIDTLSEEYQRINPVVSKKKVDKNKQHEEHLLPEETEALVDRSESSMDDQSSSDESSSDEEKPPVKKSQQKRLPKVTPQQQSIAPKKKEKQYDDRPLKKISRKTVGDLVNETGNAGVVREASSTFGNLEMTFSLNKGRAEARRDLQNKKHHDERKTVRRAAGKLVAKSAPKFWLGQRVR